MSFKDCSIPSCIWQALVLDPLCIKCQRRFCYHHHNKHECLVIKKGSAKDWYEPETSQLLALLDSKLIKAEVERLRPGCTAHEIQIPADWKAFANLFRGSFNFHLKIDFEDGQSWIMRIRRRVGREYCDQALRYNLASEVATNQALHQAGLAVPNAIARPEDSQLHPKLIYCYQSFLPGDTWQPFTDPRIRELPLSSTSATHIRSIARWFLAMEKVTFDKVGSPISVSHSSPPAQEIAVGPLVGRHPAYTIPPYYQGPFRTAKDRWLSTIDNKVSLILSHEYCKPKDQIVWYLLLAETRSLVEQCREMNDTGPFYIRHDDDRFDHIKASADGEVAGIIDWEWAYTTNKEEAFAAPNGFVPAEYHKGKNDVLSVREIALMDAYIAQGRLDLANIVKNGRKYHRLVDLFRNSRPGILIINALERSFLGLQDDYPGQPTTIVEWIEVKQLKYQDDQNLKDLLRGAV
ncbi:uncharacterized protein I303_102642 [Kwoniella dejecticola CBS 10117]|uniref:Aminoglycoside phosphotransferase domain-containing protein n=1 Tax=Kwoniella dejecticola CBS 10117 TaxID=1296121 RepID=A0A1A6A9B7_9TREE|nr:uncharacterized protein I303_02656 [Kwoniella dejecticola CBS 10117]OBR86647.1 hypothetical protein I303_02656 [Kwoniella dejecticola CBS 10117]